MSATLCCGNLAFSLAPYLHKICDSLTQVAVWSKEMQTQSAAELQKKKCLPCEGGVEACPLASAEAQVAKLPGWKLTHGGKRIRKDYLMKDFPAAIEFFGRVAEIAEADDHHPDLHLENYRKLWIELWTHAIGGLSENDFILAAKIDALPIQLKS